MHRLGDFLHCKTVRGVFRKHPRRQSYVVPAIIEQNNLVSFVSRILPADLGSEPEDQDCFKKAQTISGTRTPRPNSPVATWSESVSLMLTVPVATLLCFRMRMIVWYHIAIRAAVNGRYLYGLCRLGQRLWLTPSIGIGRIRTRLASGLISLFGKMRSLRLFEKRGL